MVSLFDSRHLFPGGVMEWALRIPLDKVEENRQKSERGKREKRQMPGRTGCGLRSDLDCNSSRLMWRGCYPRGCDAALPVSYDSRNESEGEEMLLFPVFSDRCLSTNRAKTDPLSMLRKRPESKALHPKVRDLRVPLSIRARDNFRPADTSSGS